MDQKTTPTLLTCGWMRYTFICYNSSLSLSLSPNWKWKLRLMTGFRMEACQQPTLQLGYNNVSATQQKQLSWIR